MATPTVELLFWEGCPSHPDALDDLRAALGELGLDPDGVQVREVRTEAEAAAERFPGSPTIRVDGADVANAGRQAGVGDVLIVDPRDEPSALTCRVFHRRDGRVSPTPDPDDVRDALRQALTRRSP
jgi:hypothetical protein